MANPALDYKAYFVKAQSALGTPATLTNADAVCFTDLQIKEAGTRGISRTDTSCGYGGAAQPVQGSRYFEITAKAQATVPGTGGDISTWNLEAVWEACPFDISIVTSTLEIKRDTGLVAMTDWIPVTVGDHTRGGLAREAYDVMFALTGITAKAGGIIEYEFTGKGKYQDDKIATLTAPAPANVELPIVAMNGTFSSSVSAEADFGWTLKTGLSVDMPAASGETWGYGTPIMSVDKATFSVTVQADTVVYETNRQSGASISFNASYGDLKVSVSNGYILDIEASETDGLQTRDLSFDLVYTSSSSPDWKLTVG